MRIKRLFVSATLALALGACGSDGSNGALVNVADEPAGSNCEAGGSAIETGPDDNGNGMLDADEVTATQYLCDPVVPPPVGDVLTSLAAEPVGSANCPFGGIAAEQAASTPIAAVFWMLTRSPPRPTSARTRS